MFELLSFFSVIFSLITLTKVSNIQTELGKTNSMLSKLRSVNTKVDPQSQPSISESVSPKEESIFANSRPNSVPKIVSSSSESVYINKLNDLKAEKQIDENITYIKPATDNSFDLFAWIQKNFLIKLGSLFLILGFGWFMTLAISNQWISPSLQILLALFIGTGVTVLGTYMSNRNSQASSNQIFMLTGTVINVLAFYVATNFYQLIELPVAIAAIVANILVIGTLACFKNYKVLAFVFQIALFFVPFIGGSNVDGRLFLTVYGLLIAGLSLGVNFWKHWSGFNTIGLVLSFIFAIVGVIAGFNIWMFVYIAIYFLCNFIPVNKSSQIHGLDLLNVGLSTVLSLSLILYSNFETLPKVLIIIGFGLTTALITFLFSKQEVFQKFGFANMMASLFSFGIASFLFYGVASIINLWVVAALILAGVYGCRFMSKFYETPRLISFLNFILLPLGIFYLGASTGFRDEITSQSLSILLGSYVVISLLNAKVFELTKIKDEKFAGFYYALAGLCIMGFVWYFANLILGGFGVAAALFIYAFVGLAFLYNPYFASKQYFKIASYILIGFTIVRLFVIDLWLMELPTRIITIIAIGVMFLATAFIKKKD